MVQPQSMKTDKWTDFPSFGYSIFDDDFVHHPFNLKFKIETAVGTVKLRIASRYNSTPVEYCSDTSVLWKLQNGQALCIRTKSKNYLKVHYDHGIIQRRNNQWNLYGSVNSSHLLKNASVRVGAHLIRD